ncbi:hypothetical protein MPSEU_000446300 [Mayamaea pseudoterrestris]|nr:hypothetical protein MPSEU_000446300 [Mayamaea pseudoterrestris]
MVELSTRTDMIAFDPERPSRRLVLALFGLLLRLSHHEAHAWELKRIQKSHLTGKNNRDGDSISFPITYHHQKASFSSPPLPPWTPNFPLFSALSKKQSRPPLLCIHPVGVGLASWYWRRLAQVAAERNSERDIYAINLPGCGYVDGTKLGSVNEYDDWNAFSSGALENVPQVWIEACQTLLDNVILPSARQAGYKSCHLLVQGGLAPIGVALAAQNPSTISSLILASPPTYKDLTTPVPLKDIEFNYSFLKSPLFGTLAFGVLESRWAIKVFSNAFLFEQPCDDEWLDETLQEACRETRPPVQVFNAGALCLQSLETELQTLQQPTLILQGQADTSQRRDGRLPYLANLRLAELETLPGKSLLPWESSSETWSAIQTFTDGLQ